MKGFDSPRSSGGIKGGQAAMVMLFLIAAFSSHTFAQKPLLFLPCMMCDILDDDSTAKTLSYFADYNGSEYAFHSEEHRTAFLNDPEIWLNWSDVPEPDGFATLVPS